MRVHICAVGRLRHGPEQDLISDYSNRFDRTGRSIGLGPLKISEVEDKKGGGQLAEAALLERAVPEGSVLCSLDERGKIMDSPEFSKLLSNWRDTGRQDVTFIIGGADGIHKDLRQKTETSISFGKMVWPHMLARVMLCEQLYRAASILTGAPYHRV